MGFVLVGVVRIHTGVIYPPPPPGHSRQVPENGEGWVNS